MDNIVKPVWSSHVPQFAFFSIERDTIRRLDFWGDRVGTYAQVGKLRFTLCVDSPVHALRYLARELGLRRRAYGNRGLA